MTDDIFATDIDLQDTGLLSGVLLSDDDSDDDTVGALIDDTLVDDLVEEDSDEDPDELDVAEPFDDEDDF